MKCGVPIATPVAVSVPPVAEDSALAMPKSVTTTRPRLPSRRMLSGLTSRWMIPSAWAALRASAVSDRMRRTSSGGRRPRRFSRADNGSPST
ncbi:MAG: hypothetical protein AUH68_04705 [Gemmatimonadetes bacterium 13_1_40CM_4_69_5]|nr:MAG: hypothetical protein AUH68_04705 [Gemmatimonadetes bacterium 13_1_40CM_4_69_5]